MVMLDTLLARDGVSHECASCCRKRAEGQKEADREAGRHQDLREGIRKEIITDHKIASVEDVGMMWGNGGAEKRRRRGGEEEESEAASLLIAQAHEKAAVIIREALVEADKIMSRVQCATLAAWLASIC